MSESTGLEMQGASGHACLSFDFDGPSLWMMRKMFTATPISRGEFGAIAVPRILKALGERSLPATFFIPGHTIETYPELCRQIVDAGCEIGLHGYAHELNPLQAAEDERIMMERSISLVENLVGAYPVGYRAPAGDLTSQTIQLLVEHGIRYDSSLMGHDYQPYRVRLGDEFPLDGPAQWGAETNLIELPWSWTNDDYPYLEFVAFRKGGIMPGLARPSDMFANWLDDVRWMVRELDHGVITFVMHPQVIGRGHRLLALEDFLDEVLDLGVRFAKMETVAQSVADGVDFAVAKH